MCGIAAVMGEVPGGVLPALRRMCDTARHRGPDDEGFVVFGDGVQPHAFGGPDTPESCLGAPYPYAPAVRAGNGPGPQAVAGLGHRRLSIVDVSAAGHGPMAYDDEQLWITYNGEVYNFVELRSELEALGHRFRSGTDTEVVLAAYRQWGGEFLHRLNGMFAFVIVDRRRNTVLVARDRWGIKPLYYWVSSEGFIAFASEIKQLTALPGWRARMNGARAYDYLNWRIIDHTEETLFDGVFQLRGGEVFEAPLPRPGHAPEPRPGSRLSTRRWYEPTPQAFSGSFEDATQQFHALLTDAVRLRLRADVPVGSCLSGGLDSSAIVSVMAGLLSGRGQQRTFSACSTDARFDERRWIDQVVSHTGVQPHYTYPSVEGAFDELGDVVWHQDEPFSTTSVYAQWNVFRLARQHGVVVMLDGQGADEQLAGYHSFFARRFAGLLTSLRWAKLLHEVRAVKRVHGYSEALAAKQMLDMLLPQTARHMARRFSARTQLAPEWLDLSRLGVEPEDPFARRGTQTASVEAFSIAQLTATNLQMLLHWEDRDSMAHSVESRIPFLDYRLVEFVLGLPTEFKISGAVTKRVLRESMHGVLPEPVRTRMDKMGFVTPEEVWVRQQATAAFRDMAQKAVQSARGVVRPNVLQHVERIIDGRDSFEPLAWRLITFGAWADRFDVAV